MNMTEFIIADITADTADFRVIVISVGTDSSGVFVQTVAYYNNMYSK